MKMPFRFHRGELNGFYIYHFMTCLNFAVDDILDELGYWRKVQYKTEEEISSLSEVAMRDSDIIGIGKFAGVFPLVFAGGAWFGMVYFSESQIVGGKQRSERGLYNTVREGMDYVRTENDDYPDDIVTQASPTKRMTLVPTGRPILGYVRADEDLYDLNGDVIWAHVYPTPPVDVAYDPFYGEEFSTMSSDAFVVSRIGISLVKQLTEVLQKIRYNGVSVGYFLELTRALCETMIYDISIVYESGHYKVNYRLDNAYSIDNKLARIGMWRYAVNVKFKQYELSEII